MLVVSGKLVTFLPFGCLLLDLSRDEVGKKLFFSKIISIVSLNVAIKLKLLQYLRVLVFLLF